MGLLSRWMTELSGGDPVADLGEVEAGDGPDGRWRVTARLKRRKDAWVLFLNREELDRSDADAASARFEFESVERLLEPFRDVRWRVEGAHPPRPETGTRLVTRLLGLTGLEVVHTWRGIGGDIGRSGRVTDLVLLRHRDTGRYHLFVHGPGSGHGLWPPELAETIEGLAPELRRRCEQFVASS
jgi:hypothetical protein